MIVRGFIPSMSTDLVDREKIILNLVHDYLNKNRQFTFEDILPYINSRARLGSININNEGIKTILRSLIDKKMIVEGSKLYKSEILENKKRKNIYDYIANNPGTYFNRILRELNYSNHIVVWHLSILLKFDFIHKEVLENHDIYFDAKKEFQEVILTYFTSKEKSKKIIDFLKYDNTGISKTHLSQELNMHINTINKHLSLLVKYQVLVKKRIDNKNLYFLSEV
jgi:predicted transcriptional regulator